MNRKINTRKLAGFFSAAVVFIIGAMICLVQAAKAFDLSYIPNPVVHSTFTTGVLVILTSMSMAFRRSAQIYMAGFLGAISLVVGLCSVFNLEFKFYHVLFEWMGWSLSDYPGVGTVLAFFIFSLAVLFKSKKLAVALLSIGGVALIGNTFGMPELTWSYIDGTGTSAITANIIILMGFWLLANYLNINNLKAYLPSLHRWVKGFIKQDTPG